MSEKKLIVIKDEQLKQIINGSRIIINTNLFIKGNCSVVREATESDYRWGVEKGSRVFVEVKP